MKVGIVGFGKMGMLHGAIINTLPGVQIVAITDTSRPVLRAFRSLMPKVNYHNSYEKMMDLNPMDAVIITTPSFSHAAIARYAAQKKINFFIEKPLAVNLREAQGVEDAVTANGVKGMVGFAARHYASFQKGKNLISTGGLGKILSACGEIYSAEVMQKGKGWRFDKAISGGGVVIDYAIHMIDLLYWYFGEVQKLTASARSIYSEFVDDEVEADITFVNGVQAQLKSSWSNPEYRKSYLKMTITGEKGVLSMTDQTFTLLQGGVVVEALSYPDLYQGYFIDICGSNFSVQMKSFYDHVTSGKPIEADIKSGLAVQEIVDAIYRSSEKKNEVLMAPGGAI